MMGRREDWEAATRDGARRAQLRRSLELSVRERLEVLEGLWETSRRLVEIGGTARADAADSGDRAERDLSAVEEEPQP